MNDKLALFQQATHIVGIIGGGMANLLFSSNKCIVGCILTPEFLTINERFRFSMDHTDITYLEIATHAPYGGPFSLYTRVRTHDGRIGEIDSFDGTKYGVKMSKNNVAGFAAGVVFPIEHFLPTELTALDKGLNSPFECDIKKLEEYLLLIR